MVHLYEGVHHTTFAAFSPQGLHTGPLQILVESLIFPYFNYLCVVCQDLNITLTNSLEILLKAYVRFVIGNIPFPAHVTPHRIALGWLSAKRKLEYFIVMQAYKSLAALNPSYVHSRFSRVGENITLRRSERHLAQILHCNFLRPEDHRNMYND